MIRTLRVAAVQLHAHDRNAFTQNIGAIVLVAQQAAEVADLIVLPEATFPSYVLGTEPIDDAILDGAIARLREVARSSGCVIVTGAAQACGQASMPYNAALVIDRDGSVAGRADKLFLWHFDRRWFAPGERILPIDTSIGRLGVLICADGRIPTIARALVDRGAEILVMPTAWVTSGRNPEVLENAQADLLARVRAYENGVPFVAANKCGAESGIAAYCGKSQIVAADGRVLAIAGEFTPDTLVASVDIGACSPHRSAAPSPQRSAPACENDVRVAISADPVAQADPRIEWLETPYTIAPPLRAQRFENLDRMFCTAIAIDEAMLDPGWAAAHRLAGRTLFIWSVHHDMGWTEPIARARALELRAYVIVIDHTASRAFAVDPDGNVVAGTFGEYRVATLTLERSKVVRTAVAPGSDVLAALQRVQTIVAREATVSA